MGRYVDNYEVSEVSVMSLAALRARKQCLWGCMLTADGDEHRALSPPHREQVAEDPPQEPAVVQITALT